MILRKPYALLIKNFKKIHLLLCIAMGYLAFTSNNILTFLNKYISEGTFTRTSFSLSSTYISIYMFVVALLVAIVAIIIFVLMRLKNKPKLLYSIIVLFYLGLIVYYFQVYNVLDVIEISTISPRSIRVIRDISTLMCYAQYGFILIIAVRAVGFNIKKFNFGEDLAELEIDVSDNEEFELTVGIDPDKIGRKIRKSKREIRYFIAENIFVLSLLSLFTVIVTAIVIFLNVEVYNKIYSQSDFFKAGFFVNKINQSYVTDLNQKGIQTAPNGKSFLVVSVTFQNQFAQDLQLNLDNINVVEGGDIFSPIITRYQSFIDLGTGYVNQYIKAGKSSTFIFVFEINDDTDLNNLIFRYRESLKFSTTRLEATYKKIKLKTVTLNEISKVDEAIIGEDLEFKSSSLGNTKLKINDFEIKDVFMYEAASCYADSCIKFQSELTVQYITVGKTLLRIGFNYSKDSNINVINTNTLDVLINSYGFIRYTINNKTYTTDLLNKTPSNYTGKDLYYQVASFLKDASKIELVLRIRDKEFVYNLK